MSRRLAPALAVISWALSVAALVLLGVARSGGVGDDLFHYQDAAVGIVFPVLGWIVLRRKGSHPIGWILVAAGLSGALGAFAEEYVTVGYDLYPGAMPAVEGVAWLGSWTWAFFFALLPHFLLLFPDGSLPSPRWRPVLWLATAPLVAMPVTLAAATWDAPLAALAGSTEPDFSPALEVTFSASMLALALALLAALLSLVVRWRRGAGVCRQQMKVFFLYAAGGVVALLVSQIPTPAQTVLGVAGFLLVPAGMVAAILRYRLYDIDRIVSRTVSYVVVSAVLVAMFLGLVFTFQQIIPAGSDLATAASTLAVAAAFNPLRRRVQGIIDRRFDRARYDAAATVERFGQSLRSETGVDELQHGLERVVGTTLAPSHVSLWLRRSPS